MYAAFCEPDHTLTLHPVERLRDLNLMKGGLAGHVRQMSYKSAQILQQAEWWQCSKVFLCLLPLLNICLKEHYLLSYTPNSRLCDHSFTCLPLCRQAEYCWWGPDTQGTTPPPDDLHMTCNRWCVDSVCVCFLCMIRKPIQIIICLKEHSAAMLNQKADQRFTIASLPKRYRGSEHCWCGPTHKAKLHQLLCTGLTTGDAVAVYWCQSFTGFSSNHTVRTFLMKEHCDCCPSQW